MHFIFSLKAKLEAEIEAEHKNWYCAAAIILYYLDRNDSILGETRIFNSTGNCEWKNSGTIHLIFGDESWEVYFLNLHDEIDGFLPGVDISKVKKLKISLHAFSTMAKACCGWKQEARVFADDMTLIPYSKQESKQ